MPIFGITASANQLIKGTSYQLISSQRITSTPTTTITFSSIPQTYTHLQVRWSARQTTGTSAMIIRYNGISTTNYFWKALSGDGATVTSTNSTATGVNGIRIVNVGGVTATANYFNSGVIDIHNYIDNSLYLKQIKSYSGLDLNGSGPVSLESGVLAGSNPAITQLDFITTNNMQSGTVFSLYGIKGDF